MYEKCFVQTSLLSIGKIFLMLKIEGTLLREFKTCPIAKTNYMKIREGLFEIQCGKGKSKQKYDKDM